MALLIKYGADPKQTGPGQNSLLHLAVVKENVFLMLNLLNYIDVDSPNDNGESPLGLAAGME